jgi:autotransporter-associated beta strand protein
LIRPVIQVTSRDEQFMFAATDPPIRDGRMNAPKTFRLRAFWSTLVVAAIVGCLANYAQATHYFFDTNGTTTGSGVANGGSYTWEGTKWNATGAGTTTSPIAWPDGNNFPEYAAGTDAGSSSYTITANSNHTFAGMALQTSGGGTVTIATGSGAVLTLFSVPGPQGIFVGGAATQNLVLAATIGGDAATPMVWQGPLTGTTPGSLFLYGNNTFSGGVDLNTTAGLSFNNNNSFGTGPIQWGFNASSGTSFTIAAPAASSPITINNTMVTKTASTLVMSEFAKPVTWAGPWTLAAGTSTLDLRANVDTTISGIVSGADGTSALTKISSGKLTISGTNTYAGGTTISAGTLELSGAPAKLGTGNVTATGTGTLLAIDSGVTNAIGDSSTLSLGGFATMTLGSGVNDKISTLILDGVQQPAGTYGSSQSGAVNKRDVYFSGTGILTVGPSILAGDYNNDGVVNAADYVVWRKNVGQPSQSLPNDTTGVIVGQAQYNLWRSNFGGTTSLPGSGALEIGSTIPEPSSVALLTLGLAALAAFATGRRTNGISKE